MGNDGGSIPKRRELVKEAARNPTAAEMKESQNSQQEYYWTTDPISLKPLARPIVSDSSGKLYNKDTILEFLVEGLHKAEAERITQGSIKSLKDVVEVKFEVDADATVNGSAEREVWKCPVTGDKLGQGSKAVYLVPCGHAFSSAAIKESLAEQCMTCETAFARTDIIPILPTSRADVASLSARIKLLRENGLTHSLKKASGGTKKRKNRDDAAGVAVNDSLGANGSKNPDIASLRTSTPGELSQLTTAPSNSATEDPSARVHKWIKNSSTASLTSRVLKEQERAKKRKLENENVSSLFSSTDPSKPLGKSNDFMSRGFSLPTNGER